MSRVLMIEDEQSIREEVVEWLEFEGYDVVAARNGREGVEAAFAQPPDLIVCDVMMPGMDGYEVLVTLRDNPQTAPTPFIFLTAKADRSYMRHGMEMGADDYLTKPFTRAELLSAIQMRLKRSQHIASGQQQVLEDAKLRLTRLVTHELRTPMTSIRMVKEVISRQLGQLSEAEVNELLESLGTGTDRLHHTIEQMVYMTHFEAGTISAEEIQNTGFAIYMWQILPTAVDLGRRFAQRNQNADINTDMQDGQAATYGHMPALKHGLAELVSNAINHSPDGSIIYIQQWTAEGAIWITINDDGDGMDDEEMTRALMPFEQINRDAREQQGMGLGLTVARQIIEAHGGSLQLRSAKGKGTQVIVGLPHTS